MVLYKSPLSVLALGEKAVNGATAIAAVSTIVREYNTKRTYIVLVNDSNETIYLGMGVPAVMNIGVRLNAEGGSYERTPEKPFYGPIYAICAPGAKNLCWVEEE